MVSRQIDLERNTHISWPGQMDFMVAYAHLPDEYMNDPAAAHTTIFILELDGAGQLKLVGRTSVQGCGPISTMTAGNGEHER
jgi:hypothetical protein